MKGGFGTASEASRETIVGACAVVNAFGDVVDPETGEWVAGAREEDGESPAWTEKRFREGFRREPFAPGNTTLAVVGTADLLSELMGVAGWRTALSRSIVPFIPDGRGHLVALSTGLSGRQNLCRQRAGSARPRKSDPGCGSQRNRDEGSAVGQRTARKGREAP
jgi:L-aminopeptidase/D-esterase-like protein